MMGPWLCYAALLNGAAMALPPDAPMGDAFFEFCKGAQLKMLGVVPSIVKAWRAAPPATQELLVEGLASVELFTSTGEASTPEEYAWLSSRVNNYKPVLEYM